METVDAHDREADPGVSAVSDWICSDERIEAIGRGIRTAIDWVIDGARTRRFSVEQVKQSEKLYLGNRVEHEVLHELGLEPLTECRIEGPEADEDAAQ